MTFVHRPILMTDAGAVVSGHHKASEAGAAVLRAGGNAMDAAIAASAMLSVAVPHMNGIGGDCIALYFDAASGTTTAINGSGGAPAAASAEHLRQLGHEIMPARGPLSSSVCGLVDSWASCLTRFGSLPLAELILPAADLAAKGVPADPHLVDFLSGPVYRELTSHNPALATLYGTPGSHSLGDALRNPALAASLRQIAADGAQALYGGPLGRRLITELKEAGALLSEDDLANHSTRFDAALSVDYLGRRLHAAPPNSQGLALALLSGLADIATRPDGHQNPSAPKSTTPADYLRRKFIAFACRDRFVGDPERFERPDRLLTHDALRKLQADDGVENGPSIGAAGDTSTLVVMDRFGNAVSWVQSLFEEFGSGVVSPATGIVMHNRLSLQSLDPSSPMELRGGERPFHTLCPALVEKDGLCEVAIATPGDHGQPQTIHQVLTRLYADGDNIQAAIEAPRLRHDSGPEVMVEDRVPAAWIDEIEAEGFEVAKIGPWSRLAGGVNAIHKSGEGPMMAGADPRRSCYAIAADT